MRCNLSILRQAVSCRKMLVSAKFAISMTFNGIYNQDNNEIISPCRSMEVSIWAFLLSRWWWPPCYLLRTCDILRLWWYKCFYISLQFPFWKCTMHWITDDIILRLGCRKRSSSLDKISCQKSWWMRLKDPSIWQ